MAWEEGWMGACEGMVHDLLQEAGAGRIEVRIEAGRVEGVGRVEVRRGV